ncbi:phage terminase small subunit P27 family [Faecalimicrobium sp. JNUCC 81]
MAGQKQPIELVIAKGKKHLTKAEIEERKSMEVKALADNIKPPSNLDKKQKSEFKKISKQLIELDIMSNLDCDALGFYLIAKSRFDKVKEKLDKLDPLDNCEDYDKLSRFEDRHRKQCREHAIDLGLTISSRCKLVIPKPREEPKKNKFSKFGGG